MSEEKVVSEWALERAGLLHIRFVDLRHSYAVQALRSGICWPFEPEFQNGKWCTPHR